jgi:hypothetical protein
MEGMMKIVEVDLVSTAPYSQSRQHAEPKLNRETHEDYEVRTWREKCTTNADGEICIPAMGFKQALDDCAKMLGLQIPGKGKATYTKHFKAGVICEADVPIGVHKDDVPGVTINANSDGVRGSGKRVRRTFPQVSEWKGTARFAILDDSITRDVFEKHLTEAGRFIGIGRFRPQNGGLNGRFKPVAFRWSEL